MIELENRPPRARQAQGYRQKARTCEQAKTVKRETCATDETAKRETATTDATTKRETNTTNKKEAKTP